MKNLLPLGFSIILLSGCAGGTIGGLFPAPKILDGDLDDLKYTAPDKSFSITAPVTRKGSELLYTEIKENSKDSLDQHSEYVGFKPPYNDHFYSAEVVSFKNISEVDSQGAELIIKNTVARVIDDSVKRWGSEVVALGEDNLNCSNSGSYTYSVYKHAINNETIDFDKYFLISQGYQNNKFAVIISELNYRKGEQSPVLEKIEAMDYTKHNDFVCSLSFNSSL